MTWRWNIGRQRWERPNAYITHDRASYTWTVAGFSKTVWFFGLGLAKKEADRAVAHYLWIDGEPMMPDIARFGRSGVDRLALHDALRNPGMRDEALGVNSCNPVALHAAIDRMKESTSMARDLGSLLSVCSVRYSNPRRPWPVDCASCWAAVRVGSGGYAELRGKFMTISTHSDNDEIDCPHDCGHAFVDLWDWDWQSADVLLTACPKCNRPVNLKRTVRPQYEAIVPEDV